MLGTGAPFVLLVTSDAHDVQASMLRDALGARRAYALLFDPSRFPSDGSVSVSYDDHRRVVLTLDGRRHDLSRVAAVWWQRPRSPQPGPVVADEHREFVVRQSNAMLDGVWEGLDAVWVPGRRSLAAAADVKLHQLEIARRIGLRIPRTLVTNDPAEALRFYDLCEGRLISKQLRPGPLTNAGEKHLAYTHVVRRRDLHQLASIALAPVIFQELVPKRLELRVTVVNNRAFTAAIDSSASPFTREDLRRAEHLVACTAHVLEPEIEARCIELVRTLELTYGAIDLVVTPAGEHVFLEINPGGAWAWVETRAGLPIADAIADLMIGAADVGV